MHVIFRFYIILLKLFDIPDFFIKCQGDKVRKTGWGCPGFIVAYIFNKILEIKI